MIYRSSGKYQKAERLYLEAQQIRAKIFGENHSTHVADCIYLAGFYMSQSKYQKAEPLYIKAKNISAKALGKKHPDYISSCNDLATCYKKLGKYQKAEELYLEVKKVYGKKHPFYAFFCSDLARFYQKLGKYQEAEKLYLEVKRIRAQAFGKKHPDYASSCNNLAMLYEDLGRYSNAESLYLEAKNISAIGSDKPQSYYTTYCNNLALLYRRLGLYSKAETLLQEAKNITIRVFGKNHNVYFYTCNNLAQLYKYQRKYPKAESLYREVKDIRAKELGKKHPKYAISCDYLASLYLSQAKYSQAESLFLEAKSIRAEVLGKEHPTYAISCNKLARLYQVQGQYSKAEPLMLEDKKIIAKVLGKNHLDYAYSCNYLANLYYYQRKYSQAERLKLEARKIRAKVLGKSHPTYAHSCYQLAKLYAVQGKYPEAAPLYLEAVLIVLKHFRQNAMLLSEQEKRSYFASNLIYFEDFKYLVLNYFNRVQGEDDRKIYKDFTTLVKTLQNLSLATKGQLLESKQRLLSLVKEKIKTAPTLRKTYEKYLSLKASVAKNVKLTLEQKEKRGIKLEKDLVNINTLEKELYKAIGIEQNSRQVTFTELQASLKKGEAAVEMIKLYSYYLVLITTPDTKKVPKMILLNGKDLEKRYINSYKNAMHYKRKDRYSYNQFFKPLATYLRQQGIQKIFFSPDGVYHSINLNTLKNHETGKFVEDEFQIHQVTTLRDLVKQKSITAKNTNKAYIMGHPSYYATTKEIEALEKPLKTNQQLINSIVPPTNAALIAKALKPDLNKQRANKTRTGWSDLPGTEAEVKNITRVLKKYGTDKGITMTMTLGKAVHELAIKSIRRPKILHIATHGFFIPNDKETEIKTTGSKQKIVFRGDQHNNKGEDVSYQVISANPMLRSGIALSGIGSYEEASLKPTHIEDGVLTAYEASQMDLEGTELVVLSACETGLGDVQNGEGVYGLQRAFIVAGAENVILSLWRVDDEATKILMSKFYEEWIKNGKTKREAFRAAQKYLRNLKEEYQHPYYWGAFQLIGK